MKKIKILAGVLFLMGVIVYGAYQTFFRLAVPGYTGTLVLDGLKSKVEVKTDEYAIPHIFAENRDDLFFVQGYITGRSGCLCRRH